MLPEHKKSRGFTLIEVLVVVSIIGVLSGVAMPSYKHYKERGHTATALADLKNLQYAVDLLAIDTESWPGHVEVGEIQSGPGHEIWDLSLPVAGLLANDASFPNWDGPYIGSVPKDPWGNDYFFDPEYPINGTNHVVIGSFGPNKVGQNLYDSDDIILVFSAQ